MFGFGYLPDLPDSRDWDFKMEGAVGVIDIPENFSLGQFYRKKDQRNTQRCVGFSLAQTVHIARCARGKESEFPSAAFFYTGARLTHQTAPGLFDSGTYIRAAAWAGAHHGCPPETKWPSDDLSLMDLEPDLQALHSALPSKHQLEYRRIFDSEDVIEQMLQSIATGSPVVFGIPVDNAFCEPEGPEVIDGLSGSVKGNHALCGLGYKTSASGRRLIEIGNSWGDWRKDGRAYLTEEFVRQYSADRWSVRAW